MKAAVLINPFAGGSDRLPEVVSRIRTFLSGCETCGVDAFGGTSFDPDHLLHIDEAPYVERLTRAAQSLAACAPDVYIIAGGDGLASYAADALISYMSQNGESTPPKRIGIAMGTANVGPIIALPAEKLDGLTPDDLTYKPFGAIEALSGGRHVAFGFNDIVIGNTLLGTVNGKICTLSASAMYREGRKDVVDPLASLGLFSILKNGQIVGGICHDTAQIVLSTLEREHLYGRAIAGMLCFSERTPEQAALLLSRRPLVTMDLRGEGYDSFAAASQLLFNDADTVAVEGLAGGIMLIADGNPFPLIHGCAAFRYRKAAVLAATVKEVTGS